MAKKGRTGQITVPPESAWIQAAKGGICRVCLSPQTQAEQKFVRANLGRLKMTNFTCRKKRRPPNFFKSLADSGELFEFFKIVILTESA